MINEVQKLQFELMKIATFNSFDGKEVVKDLEDNQDLWTGAIMKRNDLIPLRDIHDNYWNVDTLYRKNTKTKNLKCFKSFIV